MRRKIKCIYIDGIERSGKTSVAREMRKYLKDLDRDLQEIDRTDLPNLNKQISILHDIDNCLVFKEKSILSNFYEDVKKFAGVRSLENKYSEQLRMERNINHDYGAVHFFLIPESVDYIHVIDRFEGDRDSTYLKDIVKFYEGINSYSISSGIDIKLIPFNEHDKIYDIRDKILKILENDYEI